MDIEILLALQNFRNGEGYFLDDIFVKISALGEAVPILLFVAGIYWCINKATGSWFLLGANINLLINSLLKITFCVYRPWVRDSRIIPEPKALRGATGYSFPSGHCTCAGTFYGGLGLDRRLSVLWRSLFFFVMLTIAFTRMYLGVHTLQDVIVGLGLSLLVMVLFKKIFEKCENTNGFDLIISVIFIVIDILALIYILTKKYPVDYDADGKILVDGMEMAADSVKTVGANFAFFIGWVIERKYVKFCSDGSVIEKLIRFLTGTAGLILVYVFNEKVLSKLIIGEAFMFMSYFLLVLYIVLLFPMCISYYQKSRQK